MAKRVHRQVKSAESNGHAELPDELQMPSADIPPEAWESVDLTLPDEYQNELMAAELLENIATFHKSETARKAARLQGDNKRVEDLSRQSALCRTAAAIIQYEHPATKALYKDLAKVRALQTKRTRAEMLKEE